MKTRIVLWSALALWACGGDEAKDEGPEAPPEMEPGPEAEPEPEPEPEPEFEPIRRVVLPLGETLFLDGDDYLVDFDDDLDLPVQVTAQPAGAKAEVVGERLTPDATGEWTLRKGEKSIVVEVRTDTLNADTFQNYNYTPVFALALVDESDALVVCPTSNAVQRVVLSADGATAKTLIPTGSWPSSVAVWGDFAIVTQMGRDSLAFVDLATERVVDAIRVGNEPAGLLIEGDTAFVTLSGANQVIRVDLVERAVTGRLEVGYKPRAMALSPDRKTLYVASLLSSNTHRRGPELPSERDARLERDVAVIDVESFEREGFVRHAGTILRGLLPTPDGQRLLVAATHANNNVNSVRANSRPHAYGLAIVDLEDLSVEHLDLDRQPSSTGVAASPYTLAWTPDGKQLVASLSAGKSLLVLDAETLAEVDRIETGSDPRGLVFAHGRVWTTSWLDNQLNGYRLEGARDPVTVEIGADPRPEQIRVGQSLFNDATFSANRDFSCNNCHIDGLTDGLVWDLLVDGSVNTLAFRNIGGTDPFLWAGLLPTLFDFSREVLRLVGANASGAEMEALTAYMQSVTAPPNPFTRPGGRLTADALKGKALFEAAVGQGGAGCGGCHSGPLLTNRTMVVGKTEGKRTDVPALIGVYDTPPYGREGQWATLEDMVEFAVEFTRANDLTAEQRAQLLAYVQQIPGDQLWLNGAKPLSGTDHAWNETPIELTFSGVLAPGQTDKFSFTQGETSVPGEWTQSGRVARFLPEAPLAHETEYEIAVEAGVAGALGRRTASPLAIHWRTGGVPATDVSGTFDMVVRVREALDQLLPGRFDVDEITVSASLVQSRGGNVTGVLNLPFGRDISDFSHLEGVVSGKTIVLEPFITTVQGFGEVRFQGGEIQMRDLDGDGFADQGEGTLTVLNIDVGATVVRTALPDSAR